MGLMGADVAHLNDAATAMAPIARTVGGQATAIGAAGSLAADCAGDRQLAGMIAAVTHAVAKTTSDTGTIVANLRHAIEISAANVVTATSEKPPPHAADR